MLIVPVQRRGNAELHALDDLVDRVGMARLALDRRLGAFPVAAGQRLVDHLDLRRGRVKLPVVLAPGLDLPLLVVGLGLQDDQAGERRDDVVLLRELDDFLLVLVGPFAEQVVYSGRGPQARGVVGPFCRRYQVVGLLDVLIPGAALEHHADRHQSVGAGKDGQCLSVAQRARGRIGIDGHHSPGRVGEDRLNVHEARRVQGGHHVERAPRDVLAGVHRGEDSPGAVCGGLEERGVDLLAHADSDEGGPFGHGGGQAVGGRLRIGRYPVAEVDDVRVGRVGARDDLAGGLEGRQDVRGAHRGGYLGKRQGARGRRVAHGRKLILPGAHPRVDVDQRERIAIVGLGQQATQDERLGLDVHARSRGRHVVDNDPLPGLGLATGRGGLGANLDHEEPLAVLDDRRTPGAPWLSGRRRKVQQKVLVGRDVVLGVVDQQVTAVVAGANGVRAGGGVGLAGGALDANGNRQLLGLVVGMLHRQPVPKRVVEFRQGLGVADDDPLFLAAEDGEDSHLEDVAFHHLEQGGVPAAVDDRLVDHPPVLAVDHAALVELAVDVHGQPAQRGVRWQREVERALDLPLELVEERLVDGRPRHAILDDHVHVQVAKFQADLLAPRVDGYQLAAVVRFALGAVYLEGVFAGELLACPVDQVREPRGRAATGGPVAVHLRLLTGGKVDRAHAVSHVHASLPDGDESGVVLGCDGELGALGLGPPVWGFYNERARCPGHEQQDLSRFQPDASRAGHGVLRRALDVNHRPVGQPVPAGGALGYLPLDQLGLRRLEDEPGRHDKCRGGSGVRQ